MVEEGLRLPQSRTAIRPVRAIRTRRRFDAGICTPYGNSVYSTLVTQDRFDPDKDTANREKHKVPLAFGDRIFEDADHLIVPSIREIDGEERFKVVGFVGEKLFTGVFVWRDGLPRFISVRRSNNGEAKEYRAAC